MAASQAQTGCCHYIPTNQCLPGFTEAFCASIAPSTWYLSSTGTCNNAVLGMPGPGGVCHISVLPVELIDFRSIKLKTSIKLIWATASETDNKGFEVQQSYDGVDWQVLEFVEGHGTSFEQHEYEYKVERLKAGANYFRLKQIDFDDAFKFSNVVGEVWTNNRSELLVLPNPVVDELRVFVPFGFNEDQSKYEIISITGQIVKSGTVADKSSMKIEISELPSGTYFFRISNKIATKDTKFIKL